MAERNRPSTQSNPIPVRTKGWSRSSVSQPGDDAVRADVVVPAARPHESENLVAVAPREQRDAVGVPRNPEVLLRAEQIESPFEEARLRRGHESLRARRWDAHREALGVDGVADRIDADKWRGLPARELLERTDRVGEGGRRGEVEIGRASCREGV